MKRSGIVFPLLLSLAVSLPAAAAPNDDDDGWQAFGHALTLAQTLVAIAARSNGPRESQKAFDDVLSGRNTQANRAIAGIIEEATSDMPPEYRARVAAIGRDLTALARRNLAGAESPDAASTERTLQARKDLTAMGLSYHDSRQFLDAVTRDDALAVELYILGRGVNLESRDAGGRSALDIARARRNGTIEALLSKRIARPLAGS